ncbi:hypothetical protein IM774_12775 [Erysipelotrichaceae bacterium RD49]|nr:hypothetical protein [Erysipelotrichaceae bacterium RD49]
MFKNFRSAKRQSDPFQLSSTRSGNGYILEPVLIIFLLVILFSSWTALTIQSKARLLEASRRSDLDLAVLERAKIIAGDLSWKRRCNLAHENQSQNETIGNHQVVFRDQNTFLECSYQEEGKSFLFDVYYDETGIIKIEYGKQR